MRNKILSLLCVIGIVSMPKSLFASTGAEALRDDPPPIILQPSTDVPEGAPRGPVFNPFTAYLQGNYVILNSSASYGDVDVTLVSTAGDYYTTVFDTSDGSILIPISGFAGDYTLLLIDANGAHYVGEFDI